MRSGDSFSAIVIGCGAAGLSAALGYVEASGEAGARVAVLERSPRSDCGGATRWTSSFLRVDESGTLDPEIVQRLVDDHPSVDEVYLRTLESEAPAAVQRLRRLGVDIRTGSIPFATSISSHQETIPVGGGKAILDALLNAVAERPGVTIHYETEAVRLALGDDGHIAGVVVRGPDGALVEMHAPAVVIASGGFEGSEELLTQYLGPDACDLPLLVPGLTYNRGDGLRMASEVGAATAGQFDRFHGEIVDSRSDQPDALVFAAPYGIVVNARAERFFDEGSRPYDSNFEALAYEIWRNQEQTAYFVTDQTSTEIEGFAALFNTGVQPVVAQTVAELADGLGLDPERLVRTVDEFNSATDDTPFDPRTMDGKSTHGLAVDKTNWAFPLDAPPFVAYPLKTAVCFTFGGPRTDADGRVLTPAGRVIPGLYAAGEVTGVFYRAYPVGLSVLRSLIFGRRAGLHAGSQIAALAVEGTFA